MQGQSTSSKMKTFNFLIGLLLLITLPEIGIAAHGAANAKGGDLDKCTDINQLPTLDCASAPSSVFSATGRLWAAWSYAGHVYVNYSDDKAETFSKPVSLNAIPEKISAHGENRPKIVLNTNGNIYVSWTTPLKKRFTGNVRFSFSNDMGKSFSTPITVNDNLDLTGHRFEALSVAKNGNIYLAWLDKRDRFKAKKEGRDYHGAALYYTWSDDGGESFHPNKKIIDHSCECCRVIIDMDSNDLPVILWRNIYGKNTRDHALVSFDSASKPGKPIRVSYDNWQVDACPHHGPDLSISNTGDYHMAWFNNADKRHGLFYMRMGENTKRTTPVNFGNYKAAASHPGVLSNNNQVWLTWKEFNGKEETLWSQYSANNGETWNTAKVVAKTTQGSDYPFLITDNKSIYIQWKTAQEGFRLFVIDENSNLMVQ